MTLKDPQCLFCRMVSREIEADEVVRTDRVLAFRDTNPQAPLHVLVVPVDHHPDVGSLAAADGDVLAEMARLAHDVAEAESPAGWRWVFNTGRATGQSVFHVHGHVLGGREFTWPPG